MIHQHNYYGVTDQQLHSYLLFQKLPDKNYYNTVLDVGQKNIKEGR